MIGCLIGIFLGATNTSSATASSIARHSEFSAPFVAAHAAGKKRRQKPKHKSSVKTYEVRTRRSTITLPPRVVMKVSTKGSAGPVVRLAAGARVPAVGHGLVVDPSPGAPRGVVGVVTGVMRQGAHAVVRLRQAALSEVFNSYQVTASGSLSEAVAGSSRASTARLASGHVASLGPLSPHWSCSGAAPSPHITVDLSQVHYALSVKIPDYIQVFVGGPMKFSVGLQFSAAATCTGSLTADIPIGDTGLFIEIGPEFSVHAGGAISAGFTWEPRVTYAFFRSSTGSGNYDIHELTGSSNVDFTGAAEVSTGLGLQLGLNAFGRLGVTGTLGPTLAAKLESSSAQTCRIIEGDAEADLTAYAHVWFADWTFDLANVVFWKHEFARSCSPNRGGGGEGSGGGSGGGGGGPPPAGPINVYRVLGGAITLAGGPAGDLWLAGEHGVTQMTPSGTIVRTVPVLGGDITAGPDGNLWLLGPGHGVISKMTPSGEITEYPVPDELESSFAGLTVGPYGNLWFTDGTNGDVGRLTTAGVPKEYEEPAGAGGQEPIVTGPDGNLWWTNSLELVRTTPSGESKAFPISAAVLGSSFISDLANGPDGNLWLTIANGQVVKVTTAGEILADYQLPGHDPLAITAGPDGNLWFTDPPVDVGRITPAGAITEYRLPEGSGDGSVSLEPASITVGPDGALWFGLYGGVGRIAP